ncbi:hypothetical protein MHI24_06795 [Paenibacillus sp. FSL K6-1096]|uniref:hypothetical protein n=1 Tax=Paenibacillus sp. FSL K6-1096 TaxID=2921460 RepID=UPI0030EF92D9
MAFLSTGPIENNPVNGTRPTQQVTVRIVNRSVESASSISIQGYYLNGFEFTFVIPDNLADLNDPVQVSVWGKNSKGQLVTAHLENIMTARQDLLELQEQPGLLESKVYQENKIPKDLQDRQVQGKGLQVIPDPLALPISASPASLA